MANEILAKVGTQIALGVDDLSTIDYALTLASVANAAGRQSIKFDLGEKRAQQYAVYAAVDFTDETPSATGYVSYYWAPSNSGTQANGNVAGNSGADAACPDGALGSITIAEFVKQCQFIGQLNTHDGASVQCGLVGVFSPCSRYGQIIVYNNSGDAFEADDVEMHTVLDPIVDEVQ